MSFLRSWVLAAGVLSAAVPASGQTLEAFASLPADTFAPGPTSGQFIAPTNGRVAPFVDKQPVQGVSSVLRTRQGDFLVMSDNGFGAQANSADYVLRVYRIAPEFATKRGGSGAVAVKSFISLSDPFHKIPFRIVADGETYPGSTIAVDPAIRRKRLLTGADFDIEAFREAPDGTFWFGDEFGPFLIHADRWGRVLEAPYQLPGVQSPQNPFLNGASPTLGRSKGFEGMAIAPDGKRLYTLLEGPLTTDPDQRRLLLHEFDLKKRTFRAAPFAYRLETDAATGQAIGDLTAVTDRAFLVIERDNFEGPAAAFKKIFLVDFDEVDANGFLVKREVADLLNIANPHRLGDGADPFRFPFTTIESVIPLSRRHLGVLDDNNYPFSAGRTPGQPDPNEFIVIRLDEPLPTTGKPRQSGDDKKP